MSSQWSLTMQTLEDAGMAYASNNRAKASRLAQQALTVDRQLHHAWSWVAQVALDESRTTDAIVAVLEAARLAPLHAPYRRLLARALDRVGAQNAATDNLRQAAHLEAQRADATYSPQGPEGLDRVDPRLIAAVQNALNHAQSLGQQGRAEEAGAILAQADRWAPFMPELQFRLGLSLYGVGRESEALRHLERAALLGSQSRSAMLVATSILSAMGLAERARLHSARALRLQPDDALSLSRACCVPAIEQSQQSIIATRERMAQELDALLARPMHVESPEQVVQAPTFFLAYHGLSNRFLLTKLAEVFLHSAPSLSWTAPHCTRPPVRRAKLRVGFISKFLRRHSIGKTSKGLIAQLSRERFEVISLFLPPAIDDDVSRFIRNSSDQWSILPDQLAAARQAIADLELDILFFQDIGMESMSTYLAYARLAPVQCVSFGHPDTTGIPNMDYFVSSDLYEPEDGAEHYSERLFLLRNLPTLAYYYRPQIEGPPKTRDELGMDPDAHLYLCPQTLFKIHPEFDNVIGEILRRDPKGRIMLVNRHHPEWTHALCERMSRSIGDVMSRVHIGAGHSGSDYLQMLSQSDVMLDTPHFNGMNTSLEAFAMGTPVVTWPRSLQRGRHAAGMYRRMGLDDLIARDAQSYVELALAVGADRQSRAEVSQRILERCSVLFEDRNAVTEFERFFEEAYEAKAAGSGTRER